MSLNGSKRKNEFIIIGYIRIVILNSELGIVKLLNTKAPTCLETSTI